MERNDNRMPEAQEPDTEEQRQFTQVPNAHATGVGSMGRNDEKLPASPDGSEERQEPAY